MRMGWQIASLFFWSLNQELHHFNAKWTRILPLRGWPCPYFFVSGIQLFEQLRMGTKANQGNRLFGRINPYKQEVALDVALHAAGILTA